MKNPIRLPLACLLLSLPPLALPAPARAAAQGTPIGFEETFALAPDRARALEQLVPGSPEHYFYSCLHAQHEGDLDRADALLAAWRQRHARSDSRRDRIMLRQTLLRFPLDPDATYDQLVRRLGLHFYQRPSLPGEKRELPSRLDAELLGDEAWLMDALRRDPYGLAGLGERALERIAARELSDEQVRQLLARLQRPDVPGLARLVVRGLGLRSSRGFGSLEIHRRLLLAQLEECLAARPELLADSAFVQTYLARLAPGADADARDPAVRREHLERLERFCARLASGFDGLAAHVGYHRLELDLELGTLDAGRLLAYLRLARQPSYSDPDLRRGRPAVALSESWPTGLAQVHDDEPLVREYLAGLFQHLDSFERFAGTLRREYVQRVFAEAKILSGAPDPERWYSLLDDPRYYEELKERVEIRFPRGLPRAFAPGEPVSLEVDLKNVGTLLIKVFEIDAAGFYASQRGAASLRDVDASIDLDGLVAHEEATHHYDDPPLLRVRRSFDFLRLQGPGVYVIELIGNGLASRAVIRKGTLTFVERVGAAGHVLRILDHDGQPAPDAVALLAGREHAADGRGEVVIPFTTDPGRRPIVLRRGSLAVLETLDHQAESYALEAAVHVEREALLAGERARLLVRPRLSVAGRRVSLSLLEKARLEIQATDLDGVVSASTVRDLVLEDGRELEHEILVPARAASLSVRLAGRVSSLSEAREVELESADAAFPINGIEATDEVSSPFLTRDLDGYRLELRGKNGELAAGRDLTVALTHPDYREARRFSLQSDAQGRIELGSLEGLARLEVLGIGAQPFAWNLQEPPRSGAATQVHALEGEAIRIPWEGGPIAPGARDVSLLELRAGAFAFDRSEAVEWSEGYLVLRGLAAGDYRLELLPTGQVHELRVTRGVRVGTHALGAGRRLELSRPMDLAIAAAGIEGDELVVRLSGAGPSARVHVSAMRYLPAHDPHRMLALDRPLPLTHGPRAVPEALYESGRRISDEYRYILERRLAPRFPGNLLARAGLLLNPWAVDEATASEPPPEGGSGERFGGRRSIGVGGGAGARAGRAASPAGRPQSFASLDFLAEPAVLIANLRPDAQGVVRVPLADLGDRPLLRVVALDDEVTLSRSVLRPGAQPALRDRRLAAALDPAVHRVEERRIELLEAGESVSFTEASHAGVQVYDSLDDVFRLLVARGGGAELERFEPLLRWPWLSEEEKLALYGELACHELHVFLRRKDPELFERVVRPYLANKAHKTFLDRWLLGADLSPYLEPWAFARLNVLERILLLRELEGEPARHVREKVELMPPEPFALRAYFDWVLSGRALESERDELEEALADRERAEERQRTGRVYRGPGDHVPPGGGGGGGRPGPASPGPASPGPAKSGEPPRDAGTDRSHEQGLEALKGLGYIGGGELGADLERRQEQRALFQALPATRELAESHYWRVPLDEMQAERITPTPFWLDFAATPPGAPFVSSRFPLATRNLTEMLLALALLDLPFEAAPHRTEAGPEGIVFTAGSRLLLARKGLASVQPQQDSRPILIGQDFFRLDEPFTIENGRRRDKLVSGELLTGVPYGCRVVVTNPTSTPIEIEVLLQIPEGALPVRGGFSTRGVPVSLAGYASAALEYAFYFPETGSFRHYPAHVGEDGTLLAFAEPAVLEVVAAPSALDTTSWEHVSQAADLESLLRHLEHANVAGLDLSRLAWRMREREAYERILELLRGRMAFDPTLWSFGLHHRDARTAREYLERNDALVAASGPWLRSELLSVDPYERLDHEHLEYEPLVNARAHRFGAERRILDASFARHYRSFLELLCHKPRLDDLDRMALVHYLCLQERIAEALEQFARIDPTRVEARLQYDYLRSYLAFYTPEPGAARALAEVHAEHPVPRWRARFRDVLAQLDEAEGRGPAGVSDPASRDQRHGALAASEPALELAVEARRVGLAYANLERAELRYRPIDIELLFSTNPFLRAGSSSFAAIQPHRVDAVELPADREELIVDLPSELAGRNVLVEARAGGIVRRQAHFANDLRLQALESYGQIALRRASDGAPLPAAYVKVYARLANGRVRFHKDGYTDLRGRFDYVSVSGSADQPIERFALLVMSEEHGALVRELSPPLR